MESTQGSVQHIETRPENFNPQKRYPVIIMLNGAGSRGNDLKILRDSTILEYQRNHNDFPFIVISPLCNEDTWFDMFERLKSFILQIIELPYTDKSRIYLAGTSMGGYAAWQMLMSLPDTFAAAMICCGGGMQWNASRIKTPVWAFHGRLDKVVFVEETEKMVAAINKNKTEVRVTYYDDVEHSCWVRAYNNAEVYEWLLAHKK